MFAWISQNGDLTAAFALQAIVCGAVFFGLRRVGRSWTPRRLDGLALGTLAVLFLFLYAAWDRTWLSRALPFSSLIILGNAFPALTLALAANVSSRVTLGRPRRGLAIGFLSATAVTSCIWPVLGRPPECGERWTTEGACLQTSPFTCSAACAATLLTRHGIPATEREMADLCLTRQGTTWQGLFRGLKRKTVGTAWDVEVVECSADELRGMVASGEPLILRVGLDRPGLLDASLAADMGWRPGLRHSVVLTGFVGRDFARISDPSPLVGEEVWSGAELRSLWQGQAVRLVRRP